MSFDMSKMGGMLKKMQDDVARIQDELQNSVVVGADPGGKVTVKASGQKDILEVKIDPSAIDPSDPEMLEDLVLFAVKDALKKSDELSREKLGAFTAGLPPMPGLKMPF